MNFAGGGNSVDLFEYSTDNKYLATISDQGLYIWDIFGEKIIKKIASENLYSLSFSPDCKHVAIGSWKSKFYITNIETGDCEFFPTKRGINYVKYSPDGKHICLWNTWYSSMTLFNTVTHTCIEVFKGFSGCMPKNIAFSPDGEYITASHGKIVHILKLENNNVSKLRGHIQNVEYVDYSPNGKQIASACSTLLCIWDSKTKNCIKTFKLDVPWRSYISNLNYSQDGNYLMFCNYHTGGVYIWDTHLWTCLTLKYDRPRCVKMGYNHLYISYHNIGKIFKISELTGLSVHTLEKFIFNFLNEQLLDSTLFTNIINFVA
jgi:WD40 repeat protein